MTPGIEAVAAKKILDSRIQVFYENVSVGLGGSALTVDQRGLNEVLRRLHHKKAEKELVETTAKVLRKSNVILQEARDDARQATIEDAARAQTPEEERERLKEDIEYLAIASMAEPSMMIALSKVEKPKTTLSWRRALAIVGVALEAVK